MDDTVPGATDQLLKLVVEQIKLPLIHIARLSELYSQRGVVDSLADITSIADMTTRLIDSYMLSIGSDTQQSLLLEPVSLSAVFQDVANNLHGVSKIYNCEVMLTLGGKYAPVLTDRKRLEAAFTMIGLSLLESQHIDTPKKLLSLTTYKTSKGIAGGVFSNLEGNFNKKDFKKSILPDAKAKQAFPEVSQNTGAGILLANRLLSGLSSELRAAKHKKLNGLATTLTLSQQLQLV